MTTTVYFHTDAAAAREAWLRGMAADPLAAPGLGRVLMTELVQRLEASDGHPADRLTDDETKPPSYYIQLDGRTWVRYVVRDKRDRLFGRTRDVIVIEFVPQPPGRAAPSSGRR